MVSLDHTTCMAEEMESVRETVKEPYETLWCPAYNSKLWLHSKPEDMKSMQTLHRKVPCPIQLGPSHCVATALNSALLHHPTLGHVQTYYMVSAEPHSLLCITQLKTFGQGCMDLHVDALFKPDNSCPVHRFTWSLLHIDFTSHNQIIFSVFIISGQV